MAGTELEARAIANSQELRERLADKDIARYANEKLNPVKHSHYFKDVSKFDHIDVYRVLKLFDVTDPCVQHALKKLLVAGGRGAKSIDKDVQEAIDSLERFKQMRSEDGNS